MDQPQTNKTTFLIVIIILLSLIIAYLTIITIQEENVPGPNDDTSPVEIEGKDINKEEYIYKDELLLLGYSVNEINEIRVLFDEDDVKKYLLDKKYNNLVKFKKSSIFNILNIDRYQDYYNKNNYNEESVVRYVEIGLDNDFYTNMVETDYTKGNLILVNKYHYITNAYKPTLVPLEKEYGSGSLQTEAANQFKLMVSNAKANGITLKSVSAYRSISSQKSLYNNYVKKDGQTKADTYSARPGHSEHNTGLAVDINTSSSSKHFENSKEYEWLINNSYKYGFILRYPIDKEFITGYKFEPWHYRYIGVDDATKVHELDVTLEEYLIAK